MTDEDITAISTYLKDSGNSASRPTPVAANDNAMRAGAAIYKDSCAVCHRDSGEGESHLFPRLAGSALVQSDDPTTLAHVVLQGTRAVATSTRPTAPAMPAFDWRLNDAQVAAVITYIRNNTQLHLSPPTPSRNSGPHWPTNDSGEKSYGNDQQGLCLHR
jgi:mono/diheme cytochrome c family protein